MHSNTHPAPRSEGSPPPPPPSPAAAPVATSVPRGTITTTSATTTTPAAPAGYAYVGGDEFSSAARYQVYDVRVFRQT